MAEEKTAIAGGEVIPTPAPATTEEKVTLTKEEHAKLVKDAGETQIARDLQAQADRKAARLEKIISGKGSVFGKPAPVVETPANNDPDAAALLEDRKAERGLMALAVEPKYREILDADPTLRELLTTNPLGVLPLLAPDALDASDAIDLVKEKLEARITNFKKPAPVAPIDGKPATPVVPAPGAINPDSKELDAKYEESKKIPGTENAIANMVKIGIGRMGKH